MAEKIYRVAVIGRTGKGGYGHGLHRVWTAIPNAKVIAVADEAPGGRTATAKMLGVENSYADFRQMLENETIDIVTVAPRWLDQHHAMAMAALEHGCHVYMEKPFVPTLREADDIVQASESRHLKLAIAHTNRYSPTQATVARLLEQGEIGDVLEYRGRGKEDARRGGGEDLWVLGTHVLDLMHSLAGEVRSCFARVTENGKPISRADVKRGNEGIGPLAGDAVEVLYAFENHTTGYFSSQRGAGDRSARFGLQVFGSKGVLDLPLGYNQTAWLLRDSSWCSARGDAKWLPVSAAGVGKPSPGVGSLHDGNVAAVNDLIRAIEEDRQPLSNVYDARAATEMIAAAFESQRLGQPIPFPLTQRENPLTLLE